MEKKSYNPFKMRGSWTGLILCPILILILDQFHAIDEHSFLVVPVYAFLSLLRDINFYSIFGCSGGECIVFGTIALFIGFMIEGFFLGWIVHSLIRRLRR